MHNNYYYYNNKNNMPTCEGYIHKMSCAKFRIFIKKIQNIVNKHDRRSHENDHLL